VRKVQWTDYKAKRASFAAIRASLDDERRASSRVRDTEERELLLQLDRSRLDSWKKAGKFQILGPRRIRFKV
jgi:hypothetical protein